MLRNCSSARTPLEATTKKKSSIKLGLVWFRKKKEKKEV